MDGAVPGLKSLSATTFLGAQDEPCPTRTAPSASSQPRRSKIAYEEHGPQDGEPVVLLHGFPYDPRCYDGMTAPLAARGYRVIVPYLRGYGPTRFLARETMRSGQQARWRMISSA